MVDSQDMYSQGIGDFVNDPKIAKNDLSDFVISSDFRYHSSYSGINLDVFCYINYSLKS